MSVSGKSKYNISRYRLLREFLQTSGPDFKISDKCCDYAKKQVAADFSKAYCPDLSVTGMRCAEGGRRAGSIQSCFSLGKDCKPDSYRPLWYWSDADKAQYKAWRGLRYSDCYEVWGLKRTGCAGCPCNSKAEQELEIIAQFEPNIAKAARNIFGKSYAYRRQYAEFKQQIQHRMNS
jgi:3'-phosphoadenosine 5'-phosphosulfate sulfotransferase (PAPS reductase)/FAD synthetase